LSNSPLISVVMPNLNKGKYIRYAIESVLSQTYQNFELIIVDNGSTDESISVIQKYASNHKKIVFVREKQKGPSAAMNHGIDQASGELITFLGSDDVYSKHKLGKQVQLFSESRAFVCYTDARIINELGAPTGETYNKDLARIPMGGCQGYIFRKLLRKCDYVLGGSLMIPKDFLKLERFDTSLVTLEDPDLCVRLARHYPFRYIDETLYAYRVYSGNTWSSTSCNRERNLRNILSLHKKWLRIFPELDPTDREYIEKQILRIEFRLMIDKSKIVRCLYGCYDRSLGLISARKRAVLKNLYEKFIRL
jgi:glycosyltransferase involved in cell wall biosynthesis